jgi:hypothetical protein
MATGASCGLHLVGLCPGLCAQWLTLLHKALTCLPSPLESQPPPLLCHVNTEPHIWVARVAVSEASSRFRREFEFLQWKHFSGDDTSRRRATIWRPRARRAPPASRSPPRQHRSPSHVHSLHTNDQVVLHAMQEKHSTETATLLAALADGEQTLCPSGEREAFGKGRRPCV